MGNVIKLGNLDIGLNKLYTLQTKKINLYKINYTLHKYHRLTPSSNNNYIGSANGWYYTDPIPLDNSYQYICGESCSIVNDSLILDPAYVSPINFYNNGNIISTMPIDSETNTFKNIQVIWRKKITGTAQNLQKIFYTVEIPNNATDFIFCSFCGNYNSDNTVITGSYAPVGNDGIPLNDTNIYFVNRI